MSFHRVFRLGSFRVLDSPAIFIYLVAISCTVHQRNLPSVSQASIFRHPNLFLPYRTLSFSFLCPGSLAPTLSAPPSLSLRLSFGLSVLHPSSLFRLPTKWQTLRGIIYRTIDGCSRARLLFRLKALLDCEPLHGVNRSLWSRSND